MKSKAKSESLKSSLNFIRKSILSIKRSNPDISDDEISSILERIIEIKKGLTGLRNMVMVLTVALFTAIYFIGLTTGENEQLHQHINQMQVTDSVVDEILKVNFDSTLGHNRLTVFYSGSEIISYPQLVKENDSIRKNAKSSYQRLINLEKKIQMAKDYYDISFSDSIFVMNGDTVTQTYIHGGYTDTARIILRSIEERLFYDSATSQLKLKETNSK